MHCLEVFCVHMYKVKGIRMPQSSLNKNANLREWAIFLHSMHSLSPSKGEHENSIRDHMLLWRFSLTWSSHIGFKFLFSVIPHPVLSDGAISYMTLYTLSLCIDLYHALWTSTVWWNIQQLPVTDETQKPPVTRVGLRQDISVYYHTSSLLCMEWLTRYCSLIRTTLHIISVWCNNSYP